jgi:hypothetical protein
VSRTITFPLAGFMSDDGKTIYFWPYCSKCNQPFSFDPDEPFAFCDCGTSEWGNPRPATWIPDPNVVPDHGVLQDWVVTLPLREQGTLLAAVRGCDLATKQPLDGPPRRLTCWFRWTFMNPADPREVDIPGSFFSSKFPEIKGSDFDSFPMHWYAHIMHGIEVVAYRHPDIPIARDALDVYREMAHHLHVPHESRERMIERLSEDRIANNTVVS